MALTKLNGTRRNLDDLEILDRLNDDVELDEAVGSSWTQLLSVDRPRRLDYASFLVNVEPPVAARRASASTGCDVNAGVSKTIIDIDKNRETGKADLVDMDVKSLVP